MTESKRLAVLEAKLAVLESENETLRKSSGRSPVASALGSIIDGLAEGFEFRKGGVTISEAGLAEVFGLEDGDGTVVETASGNTWKVTHYLVAKFDGVTRIQPVVAE